MDLTLVTLVPVVSGIVEVIKVTGIPTRFMALISLILGIGAGFLFFTGSYQDQLFSGIVIGLSASGFYDVVKAPVTKVVETLKR